MMYNMSKKIEVNQWDKYWRLVIVEEVFWNSKRTFKCVCDCWSIWIYKLSNLRNWNTNSCGCYHSEMVKKHNMSNSKIYNIWKQMKYRCFKPSHPCYINYWARWISVCEERNSFSVFYDDMIEWYTEWLSIERIDNNWNYCPLNCKWVTVPEQSLNKRQNIMYKWKPLATRWRELGISKNTIYSRIRRWSSIEESLWLK